MVAVPVDTAVTRPPLTVAIPVSLDDHVADPVTFWVPLFERFAVAVSCWLCSEVSRRVEGETVTLFTV
jgi:hypothetical protein